jgi:hypothetical protein
MYSDIGAYKEEAFPHRSMEWGGGGIEYSLHWLNSVYNLHLNYKLQFTFVCTAK